MNSLYWVGVVGVMTVLRIDKCSAKCSLNHKNSREFDHHIQMTVTGTHVTHTITVTRFMQPMPILTLWRAQYCRCWTRTYSDPPFLHRWTSYRGVATWCIVPTHRNSHILTWTFLVTPSASGCNYVEDMKVEYESYKRTSYSPHIC